MGQSTTYNPKFSDIKHYVALLLTFCLFPFLTQAQVTVTVSGTNINCFGNNTGSATAIGSGGWPPYTYLWSNGATTTTINGLAAGNYQVTVTDIDLGFGIGNITISQPNPFGVLVTPTQPQLCAIAPDGKMTAVPWGGVPPLTYAWNNGQTTPIITGLSQGTYTITVTDATGCTTTGSGAILYNSEGLWLGDNSANVTCFGANNGTTTVFAMTGTPPYQYSWGTGQTTGTLTGLAPGVYHVTVTDANGCVATRQINITQPPIIMLSTSSTNANCGLQGTATITATGGTAPYSILWNTGSNNATISVGPGTYSATVTDAKGCTKAAAVTVGGSNTALNVNTAVLTNAGCTIGGSASATASGGSGNYAYSWDNGVTTQNGTNLTAGPHKVTVTDLTTGCQGIGNVNIPSASTLVAATTLVTNATCLTGGSATVTATGGTAPYTYKWSNNATTAVATNLSAGPQSVTVTDAAGCIATATVNIGQSQGPTVVVTLVSNATCTSGGSATATATGGTAPYVYLWSNGQTTATATGLAPGVRSVTVTDAAGCASSGQVTITQPGAPTSVIANSTNAGCSNPTGSATVAATGGTSPYAYKWSNNATTAVVTGLAAGTYTVTVTDAAGCTSTSVVSIATSLSPNVVISASSNAKCDQPGSATATTSNGTTPYAYKWSNNVTTASATNLAAGTYTVTVTDAGGCTATASVTIGFSGNGINIGDYIWYDNDQDGFQNPLETAGVPNITAKLIRAGTDGVFGTSDDVIVQTKVTDANGKYKFDCVTPGTYIIMFTGLPTGYEWTDKDAVNNDCKDSDVMANGNTAPFTISAGQPDNYCFDGGIHIICDNVMNGGSICCNQTICEGEVPDLLFGVAPPQMGSGAFEYQWIQLVDMGPAPPQWVGIPGANSPTYQPGALYETSYFMRCVRRAGCVTFLESNIVTITVNPAGTGGCFQFIQNFTVQPQGTGAVEATWVTYPEVDDYMYTLQHSMDMKNWQSVKTIMGKHDATQPNAYDVIHESPAQGKNFYRVKRTNANNIISYSEPRDIDLTTMSVDALSISPNPIQGEQMKFVNLLRTDVDVTIQIISVNGTVLHTQVVSAGQAIEDGISVSHLAAGLYFVKVQIGTGEKKTLKFTKF
jgi:hypothetical protein